MKNNIIKEKSFDFALKIIELYKHLKLKNEFVISAQILRSGTSIGANIEEAIAAQSSKDFVAKLSIALKEARETRYWLNLLERSKLISYNYTILKSEAEQIINILCSIIKTMNRKRELINS